MLSEKHIGELEEWGFNLVRVGRQGLGVLSTWDKVED